MVSLVEVADATTAVHNVFSAAASGATELSVGSGATWSPILLGEDGSVGYSKFSYYTTLGLYVLSFPGLWSVVKRATKTK